MPTIIDPMIAAINEQAKKFDYTRKDIDSVKGHYCDSLRGIFKYYRSTVSAANLQDHAFQCSVCCLLLQIIDAFLTSDHRENAHITHLCGLPFDTFFVTGQNAEDASIFHSDPFFLYTPSDSPITEDFPFRIGCDVAPVSSDTSSSASISWAASQIAECDQHHECILSTEGWPLPSRVLDVSPNDAGNFIRLLTTTHQRERYICLSHCWGEQSAVVKTTWQNLESHMKSIAIDKLPKTFQDAVDITRRLGVDYLWIDSLCIIQDSEDDWENEASRMADIFEGAYLTIAATASVNSSEGCYRSYPPSIVEIGLSCTTETGLSSTIHCRQLYQHIDLAMSMWEPYGGEKPDEFPLLDRGWVFQEWFLSSRMLHFGNFELVFECQTGIRCQCNHGKTEQGFKRELLRLFARGPGLENFDEKKGWWAAVRRYTRLKLTYDQDILTALSGISRRVGAERPAEDYVAGIWKNTLPYSLLWYASPGPQDSLKGSTLKFKRADSPRAPSWSWASVIAPIEWSPNLRYAEEHVVTIHDISCEISKVDPYGRVYGGSLSITGPILISDLRWQKHSPVSHGNHPTGYKFHFSAIHNNVKLVFHPDYPFFANKTGSWTVQCLWVLPNAILVLKQLEESGDFERIGLLTTISVNTNAIYGIRDGTEDDRRTETTVKII